MHARAVEFSSATTWTESRQILGKSPWSVHSG
jgi:hypothetical protein